MQLILRLLPIALVVVGISCRTASGQDPAIDKSRLHKFLPVEDKSKCSLAYEWLDIAEEATAREVDLHGARPPIVARTLAIWATAMFDAWSAYDEKAVGSRLGGTLRRPVSERTLENKKRAISYASYHSLAFVYPESKDWLAEQMKRLGYDPYVVSQDPTKPEGVGYLAAQAVIEYRRNDGANQFGNEVGSNGTPYSDYTYYRPVNPPDKILDPDRWQPIYLCQTGWHKVHARLFDSPLVSRQAVCFGKQCAISARASTDYDFE